MSGHSGALKPGRLGLSCKVNKYSGTGTGGLDVHTTGRQSYRCFLTKFSDGGSGDLGMLHTNESSLTISAQPTPGECHHKYK